ncbi:ferrochelatase [Shewanella loihica]|uniref:Ferrochelatase n=1 Tax=Shewanella loihica (strain ATCC BAA-1088 / PV-4) TaxID=323850 RepID=A3QF47_SHELP|nr:ferrochelatase [Shewanella loihica]ABO24095.1 Ferrochelatase [Shewanella loihica PV-4]
MNKVDNLSPAKLGVLLVNLGTPDTPTPKDVKQFLKQFLSDPRVVDLNPWIWKPILNGIILNTRPKAVAKLYESIWWPEGSPLMVISERQREALSAILKARHGSDIPVELGMSYGNPSLSSGIDKLVAQGVERLVVLPLYPQYSCSTVAPVFDAIASDYKGRRNYPETRFSKEYFEHPAYIAALAGSVRRHWQDKGQGDCLLMSFHGVPLRYVTEGDPYQRQCQRTAELLAAALGLTESQWRLCFQSKFGKEEWLTPATDALLESLPGKGVKRVDILCPAFAVDCLETLEEISIGGKESFIEAGGEDYHFIPCLNEDEAHMQLLADLVDQQAAGWLKS